MKKKNVSLTSDQCLLETTCCVLMAKPKVPILLVQYPQGGEGGVGGGYSLQISVHIYIVSLFV